MTAKLPDDDFDYYVGLGPGRSYELVAQHFGVTKRTVVRRARRSDWQGRLATMAASAREAADRKLGETVEHATVRHLRTLRAIQSRALKALQTLPIDSGLGAVRALELAIRAERAILKPKGEGQGKTLEEILAGTWDREAEPAASGRSVVESPPPWSPGS